MQKVADGITGKVAPGGFLFIGEKRFLTKCRFFLKELCILFLIPLND